MSRFAQSSLQSLRAVRRPTVPRIVTSKKFLHETRVRNAIMMPATSPLLTEGAISRWLKKEGEAFQAGDVLLRIESDIYTVDVEAQSSGILGKILRPDGSQNVPIEEVIALVVDPNASPLTPAAPQTATPRSPAFAAPPSPARPAFPRSNSKASAHAQRVPAAAMPSFLGAGVRSFAEQQHLEGARAYSAQAAPAAEDEGSAIRRAIVSSMAQKSGRTSGGDDGFDELL